jgi:ribosomal-protein-alanine N-acetyltransferase
MVEMETARLRLRRFTPYDLDGLARIDAEPETRGFLWDGPVDRETTARRLRRWMAEYGRGLGHLAMIHKPNRELIGHCGLTERDGRVFLSYALRKDYWCRGLAPEAAAAVLSYGFEELGLEEIWTETRPENSAWRGMMERLGMVLRKAGCGDGEGEVFYAAAREGFFGTPTAKAVPVNRGR